MRLEGCVKNFQMETTFHLFSFFLDKLFSSFHLFRLTHFVLFNSLTIIALIFDCHAWGSNLGPDPTRISSINVTLPSFNYKHSNWLFKCFNQSKCLKIAKQKNYANNLKRIGPRIARMARRSQ